MRWRVALGVCAALLLPIPLIVLLSHALHPRIAGPSQGGRQVSPVLGVEERTRRETYHRKCRQSSDCEEPLGCVVDGRAGATYCTDSECMADSQCPDGLVCRSLATKGEGPLVRFCIPQGPRRAGERCDEIPLRQTSACGPGLQCGGVEGWCGHPCQRGEAASCPEGFFCADVAPEPLCLPTCEARGCPSGQECIRYKEGVSSCAVVYGRNCQNGGCPADLRCRVLGDSTSPGNVWMDCVHECGPGRPACPEMETCSAVVCLRSCDPESSGACGANFRCRQLLEGQPWVCAPDW
jgi:hypothetical protein